MCWPDRVLFDGPYFNSIGISQVVQSGHKTRSLKFHQWFIYLNELKFSNKVISSDKFQLSLNSRTDIVAIFSIQF